MVLQPLQMIYNPHLVERLVEFGQYMSALGTSAALLSTEAGRAVEGAAALDSPRVLDLAVTVHAPTILLPDDCRKEVATCLRVCLGDLSLTTGAPTDVQDVFAADVTNMQVELCDVQLGGAFDGGVPSVPSVTSNRRLLFSQTGSAQVDIKKRGPGSAGSGVPDVEIRAAVSPFSAVVSDELLVGLTDLIGSIGSQRKAVLAELAGQGVFRSDVGVGQQLDQAAAGSTELVVSVEFEGLRVSLAKGAEELAVVSTM